MNNFGMGFFAYCCQEHWRNEIHYKVHLSTLFPKRNTTFHSVFLSRLSVQGPCPSRGALVSGVVTLSQYPSPARNTTSMKFDVSFWLSNILYLLIWEHICFHDKMFVSLTTHIHRYQKEALIVTRALIVGRPPWHYLAYYDFNNMSVKEGNELSWHHVTTCEAWHHAHQVDKKRHDPHDHPHAWRHASYQSDVTHMHDMWGHSLVVA